MLTYLRTSIVILGGMTLLTGAIYPAVITAVSQIAFPYRAGGSILREDGIGVGSELIGQSFTGPEYFWGRLSATSPHPFNAASSTGSNYGTLHPDLTRNAGDRIAALMHHDPRMTKIPVDLVTASASGLDPHLSPLGVEVQVRRVAGARRITEDAVRELVRRHTSGRQLGLLGEPCVNVLLLNRALDHVSRK
jgi:potassium-transporting ATPase KdpC subunit